MGKLYGLTVGKNESRRYLKSMMSQTTSLVDELFYYDDQSTDDSLAIVAQFNNVHRTVRPDHVPSFLEHEGKFRQDAWNTMQSILPLKSGDWILAIDTDEVVTRLTDGNCCLRCEVDQAIESAERIGALSVVLPVPEIFGVENGVPMVRTDGLWGTIRGTRLFAYRAGGVFADKSMGSGSEPGYVAAGPKSEYAVGLHLMHFGYADPRDLATKYRRYSDLLAHGHNDNHIKSIVSQPVLKPWPGVPTALERAS